MNTIFHRKASAGFVFQAAVASHNRRPFTLIELLVVVAIIAILASLILPALKGARERVKSIYCMNNEKQMATAFLSYCGEWDGWLPSSMCTSSPWGSWSYLIAPYLGMEWSSTSGSFPSSGQPVFYCPSADRYKIDTAIGGNLLWNLSYGYNRHFYETAKIPCRISSITNPSKCLLVADLEYVDNVTYFDGCNMSSHVRLKYYNLNNHQQGSPAYFAYRHSLQANMLFIDGHSNGSHSRNDGYPEGFYFYEGGTMY